MADTSSDRLYQVLNDDELPPFDFTPANVALGVPVPDASGDWNTKLVLTGIPAEGGAVDPSQPVPKGYFGTETVFYTRVSLTALGTPTVQSLDDFTLQSIIDQLNASLGTFLTVDDFEPVTIPTVPTGDSANVTLTAVAGSIGWIDTVTVTLTHDKPLLSAVIGVKALSALANPIGPNGKMPGYFLTGVFDFTSMRDSLVVVDGNYADFPTLQSVLTKLGIPGFTQWTIEDLPTSSVPTANQSFDRVVVQSNVVASPMGGPLYFHYNLFDET